MRELSLRDKEDLCDKYNSDRIKFTDTANEIAGAEGDSAMLAIIDRLYELYKQPEIEFGENDNDFEEEEDLQERLLSFFGVEIDIDKNGKAFIIGRDDIVSFETNKGLRGIGVVEKQSNKSLTIKFDPLTVSGDYKGDGEETFDKSELTSLKREEVSPFARDVLTKYIVNSRDTFVRDQMLINERGDVHRA